MPIVGMGLWKVSQAESVGLVQAALRAGYRHLDCACDHGNEPQVGHGIRAALTAGLSRRADLWITSKLWNTYHARAQVRPAVERTLRDLQIEYLDLYLIHFPSAQEFVPFELRYPPEWYFDPTATDPRPLCIPRAELSSAP
jgi:diketogulonate reductase-like aldo/keto reductase